MKIENKKFVVTGGAGFIGSNIVRKLLEMNNEVTVIDDLSTGREENLSDIKDKIKFIRGSILDKDLLDREFQGVDYILHQAAIPSVPKSVNDPITTNDAGTNGTLNVLVAARDAGVKRVVYASSSSVYGANEELPKKEEMTAKPLSPYALSKLTAEEYCRLFYELYGLETVSLIYFNVFGPRQNPDAEYAAVIPKFITLMLNDEQPVIYGDGKQSRDFTYIENNVNANILACLAPKEAAGQRFNIACGNRYDLIELVDILNELLGKDIKPLFEKARPGDVRHSMADISKAKKFLNYEVGIDFKEGLKKTIEWLKQS